MNQKNKKIANGIVKSGFKISIGITGQSGFVGSHLFETLGRSPEKYICIPFEDSFFDNETSLRNFVKQCDVILHFAALVRSERKGVVYNVNIELLRKLIEATDKANVTPSILFSTSIQEGNGTEYGQSKLEIRQQLEEWACMNNTGFKSLIFPNLFGPGARPNSHSFIATFCYKLTHDEEPQVLVDNTVQLKYIESLMNELPGIIEEVHIKKDITAKQFAPDFEMKVSEVLHILQGFKAGVRPMNEVENALYRTYESYKDYTL